MFGEKGPQKHKFSEAYTKLSDEDLLERYEYIQKCIRDGVDVREHPETQDISSVRSGKQLTDEEKSEGSQRGIETNFEDLNALRAEIEKRGLQAPTMEDRNM